MTESEKVKLLKFMKVLSAVSLGIIATLIAAGFLVPFDDREAICSVCGMKKHVKSADWLDEEIAVCSKSRLSRYYYANDLPTHEHNWEYLGGIFHTNLYGVPTRYEYERSDPLYSVSQEYMVNILRRLEKRNAQLELLRAINSSDHELKEDVRSHLYEYYPGKVEKFIEWWEIVMTLRQGDAPSDILPGETWEKRTSGQIPSEQPESPYENYGQSYLIF